MYFYVYILFQPGKFTFHCQINQEHIYYLALFKILSTLFKVSATSIKFFQAQNQHKNTNINCISCSANIKLCVCRCIHIFFFVLRLCFLVWQMRRLKKIVSKLPYYACKYCVLTQVSNSYIHWLQWLLVRSLSKG